MSELPPELFTPYPVLIETTYGIVLKLYIKSEEDEEKLRQSNFNWRTTGAKSAPLQSGGLSRWRWRKSAPVAPLSGATVAQPALSVPPLRSIWSSPEGEKEKLKSDLSALREMISELAKTISGYDRLLAPYWHAKGDVEDAIRRTHHRRPPNTIVFNPGGASNRKPSFDALMELAIEWGPTKAERSELQTRMKAHEREAGKLETELKYLAKKKVKKHAKA